MFRRFLCVTAVSAFAGTASADQEQRLENLEQRLQRLEAPQPALGARASANSLNPAVSVILSGVYSNLSQDPEGYRITDFALPADAEIGPGSRGFSLAESELNISANIDPLFYGSLTVALTPENEAAVEEAYIQTIALGRGVTLKAGRFLSGIGYLNMHHAHTWDFVDAPLVYQAMFAGQYGDDGVQLKWLAPTDLFVELGAELNRGAGFPGSDRGGNGAGAATLFAHAGGDVGTSHSWRAGVSLLSTSPRGREFAASDVDYNEVINSFDGDSRLWLADFIWKYAPNGNPVETHFKLQAEYMQRHEDGDLTYDADSALGLTNAAAYDAKQSGWYLQAVYQFMRGWRAGLRADRLDGGSIDYGANAGVLAASDFNPSRNSAMLDWSPSEFSRIRLQYAQDKSRAGVTDDQVFVQYLMSLGAHSGHRF